MKVTSVAPIGPKGRAIYVEVGDLDIQPPATGVWSARERFQKMTQLADLLVVEYLRAENEISPDFASQRVREIGARYGG